MKAIGDFFWGVAFFALAFCLYLTGHRNLAIAVIALILLKWLAPFLILLLIPLGKLVQGRDWRGRKITPK